MNQWETFGISDKTTCAVYRVFLAICFGTWRELGANILAYIHLEHTYNVNYVHSDGDQTWENPKNS